MKQMGTKLDCEQQTRAASVPTYSRFGPWWIFQPANRFGYAAPAVPGVRNGRITNLDRRRPIAAARFFDKVHPLGDLADERKIITR